MSASIPHAGRGRSPAAEDTPSLESSTVFVKHREEVEGEPREHEAMNPRKREARSVKHMRPSVNQARVSYCL